MFHLGLWLSFFFNMQGSFHFLFQFDRAVIFCLSGLYTKKLEGDCFYHLIWKWSVSLYADQWNPG